MQEKSNNYKSFKQIANTFYNEELEILNDTQNQNIKNEGTINIEPKIIFDKLTGSMKVEFKIGTKKKYKLKNLPEFFDRMTNKEFYRYGESLQFTHVKEMFDNESQLLLDFILKYAETIKMANSGANNNYNYYGKILDESKIILGNSGIDDVFEALKGRIIAFQKNTSYEEVQLIDGNPEIEFTLRKMSETEYTITPNIEIFKVTIIRGRQYKYVLKRDKIYRCTKEFEKTNLKLLEIFRQNYITEVHLGKEELKDLFSIVMPKVKDAIKIENMTEEEVDQYKPKQLVAKAFLDFDKKDYLIADLKFFYENKEFNPLDESLELNFPRNIIQETKLLNMFKKTGFMFDTKKLRFILTDNDKIYKFLSDEIDVYAQKFDILVTDNFKSKQIKPSKIGNIGIRVENNLLKIELENVSFDINEIEQILIRYKTKKKYHRLKNGEFIDLVNNNEIEFLDKLFTGMEIEYEQIKERKIEVPKYRILYLNQLLKELSETEITKDTEYKNIINKLDKESIDEEIEIPEEFEGVLRYYQKTGYKWLKILDDYKLGGILADDMGLGKTLQVLAIISNYIQEPKETEGVIEGQEEFFENNGIEKNKKRSSLVIVPSSLALNWQNEAKKFAKSIHTLVIKGNAQERRKQINSIDNYDLIITSYDLLKRDLEEYKKVNYYFKYIIADEAQYLKNSTTQNAKAIKELKSDTRFALTGTPIENTLAELWSIFDFIMPGYLFPYKKFKANYEMPIVRDNDKLAMEKLKMLIQPFVLRRTKIEVLTQLPEKTITVLNNEMAEEQRNIYMSYLAKAKQEVAEKIDVNGYKKSQMKILALLTRLRQICCHPSLFLDDYKSGSSKLEQCMEIIEDAISGGHKILLFSSYTSMFDIIEEELEKRDINYFKLTGATKVDDRIDLVDEFNENDKVKVFLISLKAGGTGINLTGADVVIHYDPWWNLSAENQATDRAYRIGQKKNVQVYKLITKNTIEEKIYELQQRKAALIDNMLSTQTVFANKLSKEEILELFK